MSVYCFLSQPCEAFSKLHSVLCDHLLLVTYEHALDFEWVSKRRRGRKHERAAKSEGAGEVTILVPSLAYPFACATRALLLTIFSKWRAIHRRSPPIQNTRISFVSPSNLVGNFHRRLPNLVIWGDLLHGSIDCNYRITLVCLNCLGFCKSFGHFLTVYSFACFFHIFYKFSLSIFYPA